MAQDVKIKRALISVTDKTGVVEFAKALQEDYGVEVISTGGTARALVEGGVPVTPIEEFTGFPEMMDGRVKTLHPKVHGGLLARRDSEQHMAEAAEHDIKMIDLVCVNLYEFEKTVAKPDVTFADAIEHIDIGGPSMLRSAAKNNDSVTVVCDPADYEKVLEEMRVHDGSTTLATRRRLAAKVYTTTAAYDTAISLWLNDYLGGQDAAVEGGDAFEPPAEFSLHLTKVQDLRYGENPHQSAAVYQFGEDFAPFGASANPLVGATQIQGKPLSYNNLLDADAAWNAVREFDEPACVILKHQNPCGSAVASDVTKAYDRAFACDPKSAFGGIIAVNREVPYELVEHFADQNKQFVEVLIAPGYTQAALDRLAKRTNLRVLATGGAEGHAKLELRSVDGGMLVQCVDTVDEDPTEFTCPTIRKPTDKEMTDLLFAWRVVKTVKSNAILVAKNEAGIGMGPGQPNRVDSALMACERAEEACERMGISADNLVAASDAFFPFRDNVDVLAEHGVTAIIQPGGSVRDDESIKACDDHGIAMIFTGTRHFRH
ncbi:bifunctional phosphoribosylaminoimidazolecarboxamide formyltransferase/IMP cyclohydrolase [Enorma phocaeensis]|uniref:Bifunctional purine biosynthesis protein PurH n=1 Tax=Enorma phocaeensis TaxID=1871019 RepID=A0ABT7V9B2_9ACTN|nr:bifunctional phosphoribosylaminoimidazolecarboxamide formyltransferase/IMP cyclohydrolase [Enorma phocaeensis]MBM6953105.1 bifunctional phosphoribosylaminoimidazolecarboxamide formyltransferase/IMP cyclohydrolase [Enorma phocaeensis]MDM8275091.1 bifunctional phosphoribosylaminoimidazolecarboxamide formyltransferase/IMP cyclohydrolase [Enorma phocaeensis]